MYETVASNSSPILANQTEIYEQPLSRGDKVDSHSALPHSPHSVRHNTSLSDAFVQQWTGDSASHSVSHRVPSVSHGVSSVSHNVSSQLGPPQSLDDNVLTPLSGGNKTNMGRTLSSPVLSSSAWSKQSNISATNVGPPTYPDSWSDSWPLNKTESTTSHQESGLLSKKEGEKVNLSYRVHSPEQIHSDEHKISQAQSDLDLQRPIEDRPPFPTWAIALLAFIAVLMLLVVILYLYN